MPSPNEWPTNWPELYRALNLEPHQHALYVVDNDQLPPMDTVVKLPKVFLISGEGNTSKFQHLARPGVWFFDSIVSDQYPNTGAWMFHFDKTIHVNQQLGFAFTSQPNTHLKFDMLLGLQRPHRDMAWDFVHQHPDLKAQCYVTYYGRDNQFVPGYQDQMTPIEIRWSSECITIDNVTAGRSQIMPLDVYSQTCYSVVCETNAEDRHHSFFTEKIAKPMLAGRPFVVLANKYYLRRLRQLGFETFDSVLDESYDCESDHVTRWRMALQQVQWLSQQDSQQIYLQLARQLAHNQNQIQSDWPAKLVSQIAALV